MRTSNYRKFKITKKQAKIIGGVIGTSVPGWKVLYQSDKHDDDEEEKGTLPAVRKGDGVHYQNGQVDKKATKPPPRFTPSTLLAAMKEIYKYVKDESLKKKLKEVQGIGTEATRATSVLKTAAGSKPMDCATVTPSTATPSSCG